MKTKIILSAVAALALASCADLGFGIDADSGGVSPYWYGDGFYGGPMWNGPGWNGPYWNYGPVINNGPVYPPPVLNPGVGPVRPPVQINPGNNNKPSRPPVINANPGNNGRPSMPQGSERPGNMGLPTNNNARRGT